MGNDICHKSVFQREIIGALKEWLQEWSCPCPPHRFGGWQRPAVLDKRRGPFESSFRLMEKDALLQAAGGLQDHVAWIQKDLEVQKHMWVPKGCQKPFSPSLNALVSCTDHCCVVLAGMCVNECLSQKLLKNFLAQIHIFKHKLGTIIVSILLHLQYCSSLILKLLYP